MKDVITSEQVPIKLWLDDIEEGALEQAKNLANLPFVFRHIAIMPDAHQGYGMPIGGVMATRNVVVPNAVGVDIGCGMCAVQTNLTSIDASSLKTILRRIRQAVPVGMRHHDMKQREWLNEYEKENFLDWSVIEREYLSSLRQLGTLGGGNHFIEIQKGDDGFIWLMLHSGSRNIGFKVAKHYNNLAVKANARWFSEVPEKHDLAFLPLDTADGQAYLKEMLACVQFAYENRRLMMERIQKCVRSVFSEAFFASPINVAHNYAIIEHHFGKNVVVHRKGATYAGKDGLGIIPGSQGTSSYIVRGLGNPESFQSCSHGAGRKMGRKQAQRELNFEVEKKRLDDLGVIHGIQNQKDLDEAAGAYKDISEVMANQADLVEIIVELTPLAVIKG